MTSEAKHQICDYEGSAYRKEFWGEGREYEDGAERVALRHLLPPRGHRLIDIGGGYGRLASLYRDYDEVVIFDYALSQLRQAQELWGNRGPSGHPRYIYVAGDFYKLPFAPGLFDTVTMVRTLHHAADAPTVLRGVAEILVPGGTLVLEFANKRNLKAILRYLVGRQAWSPFEREPVEFVALNFDFHPAWVEEQLAQVGLRIQQRRAVSTFRLGLLKRLVPTDILVALDRLCQPAGGLLPLSPSVFVRCAAGADRPCAAPETFFRCTTCGSTVLTEGKSIVSCVDCSARFAVREGIYDFKEPLEGSVNE
ncbi:MAG: class I SAM-dependent methyltransferase [Anaerolineae bacterium]|jgi:SAM-dependent methyltransferase/DNA-directed RNA polymerase subunit RPC12/RpoP